MLEYIFAALIISKWFSILREPDQLFSWYNRMLIGWDEGNEVKQFFYKVLTCSLCHSGYLSIYFILAKDQHFIILPVTMVVYYLLSKIKFQ
jgi:hypothetical protein